MQVYLEICIISCTPYHDEITPVVSVVKTKNTSKAPAIIAIHSMYVNNDINNINRFREQL